MVFIRSTVSVFFIALTLVLSSVLDFWYSGSPFNAWLFFWTNSSSASISATALFQLSLRTSNSPWAFCISGWLARNCCSVSCAAREFLSRLIISLRPLWRNTSLELPAKMRAKSSPDKPISAMILFSGKSLVVKFFAQDSVPAIEYSPILFTLATYSAWLGKVILGVPFNLAHSVLAGSSSVVIASISPL